MSLYLKHRPKSFAEMVGNQDEILALQDALDRDNPPHVFLFAGNSGCGKTTTARIIANHLGVTELGIQEINAANARGIDTAREIIEKMRSTPIDGGCWAFIMDEAHRFTIDMQNAMLKPLEDTPAHVYFFLCTTDPQKLITPLKNRCFPVAFKAIPAPDLFLLLKRVQKAEGTSLSRDVLEAISKNSDGSPRSALQLMDKVLGADDEDAQLRLAEGGFVEEEDTETIAFCRLLLNPKSTWSDVAKAIKSLDVTDPEKIRYAVLGYMNAVLLSGKENLRAAQAIEFFSEPFYNSLKAGVTLAAYQTVFA